MATMDMQRGNVTGRPVTPVTEVVETNTLVVEERDGVNWGAIIAGAIVTMVFYIGLNFLGLAIGATSINPIREANPVGEGFGTAAILWMAGSGLLALFAGGWVASHLARLYSRTNGALHGLVVWGVATLIMFLLVGSAAGGLISGVTNAAGQAVSLLTQGAVAAVPAVANAADQQGLTLDAIIAEASRRPQPAAGATGTDGATTGTDAAAQQNTGNVFSSLEDLDFNSRLTSFITGDQSDATVRQELVTGLAQRTGVTEQEANAQIDRWTTAFTNVASQAEETAREVGQQLTNTLAALAGGLFLAMVLGAFAAAGGGYVGTRDKDEMVHSTTTTHNTRAA